MLTLTDNEVEYLKRAPLIGLDLETKDPCLTDKGPGTFRKDGHICGVALGDRQVRAYLSFAHPDTKEEERLRNRKIVDAIVSSPYDKVGANIIYDMEWLQHEGSYVKGKLHDVQYAEPLLNEYHRSYSLDNLAKIHGLKPKATNVLSEYNETMGWKGKPITNIWRMPSRVAGEYALVDIELPLDIFEKQKEHLALQGLMDVYEMETDLIPLILQMRFNGVRLDMARLEKTIAYVTDKKFEAEEKIYKFAKREFNIGSTKQLTDLFDEHKIAYPHNPPTAKMKEKGIVIGNPNLDKDAMELMSEQHAICSDILHYRYYNTMINTFLFPYLDLQVDGRLHGQLHPLRTDKYGTVSGRFSASRPNLQQVSAKEEDEDEANKELLNIDTHLKGQIIRELFIPEEDCDWAKLDYSQVEYRIIAHYATGRGARELRALYNADPKTDFHKVIQDKTKFDRRTTKRLNFGGAYGMGRETAAKKFRWTMDVAENFMRVYHAEAPYIKATRKAVANVAKRRGFIHTILGRKARTHPSRKLHSMFNRLMQGSAADIMKKAMVDAYKKGLFDVLIPHMTVHDEIDVSVPRTPAAKEALAELKETMEHTVKLDVPLLVDCHVGKNWADAD